MTYLQGSQPKPEGCLFCNVTSTPASDAVNFVLHRGQHAFIILNLYPYNNGHLMIVPFSHVDSIEHLSPDELGEMMALSQKCLAMLRQAYNPQGFNMGVNIGGAAGAGVPGHVHMHIVPRWTGDSNFMTTLANTRVIPEVIEHTYERLKALWLQAS